jgi:tyrosyl-tRNA synthetase
VEHWANALNQGPAAAEDEDRWFIERFSHGEPPGEPPEVTVAQDASTLSVVRACLPDASASHARRLIRQGAVKLGDRRLVNPEEPADVAEGEILQIGKRRWFKLRLVPSETQSSDQP